MVLPYLHNYAVRAQRIEPSSAPDDFPTPPWATRALLRHVIGIDGVDTQTCLEPACGAGHMARALQEAFGEVFAFDSYPYGFGLVQDFLKHPYAADSVDWVITNPPFNLAEEFVLRALPIARIGVAVFTRTTFIESVGRYQRLFRDTPPSILAQFVERVPLLKGRLDPKGTTATGYCWLVWERTHLTLPELIWIPPCRKALERADDYVLEDVREELQTAE